MAVANGSSRWTDALLDPMREVGDPLADEPVAAVLERGGANAVNAMMQTLVRVDQPVPEELPDEIRGYLASTLPLPDWADPEKIKRGQLLFETWGLEIACCLFCASLPSAYAAAKGVQVLYLTAQLATNARRRVVETGQFLIDVANVGGLDENGKGRRVIQRVRLMHAAVRHLIKARNEQKPGTWHAEWGIPINQEDLAGTRMSFSYVFCDPMRRLGVRVADRDVEAYLHLWNVIGHLLGLRDELLVHDIADATALVDTIRRRQFAASLQGQEMTRALLGLMDELTPVHELDGAIPPLIRHLIGNETADLLLVPTSNLAARLAPLDHVGKWFFVHVLGQVERDLPYYPLASRIAAPLGRALLDTGLRLERGGDRAPFDIPEHLARGWQLKSLLPATSSPPLERLDEAKDTDDVLRNIERVVDWSIKAESHLGYFAVVYKRVTLGLRQAIAEGRFDDGKRVAQLDVAFAQRYFNALNAYFHPTAGQRPTLPWEVAFVGDQDGQAIILQDLLCGFNAHISFDLGIACVEIAANSLDSMEDDFNRVNAVLCSQIPGILKIIDRLSPDLRWARWLIPDELGLLSESVRQLRRGAWLFAIYLATHPRSARQKTVHQEAWTAELGSWYLQPTGLWSPLPRLVSVVGDRESRNVGANIRALDEISGSPDKLDDSYL